MPYKGPSQGCFSCRKRKIKCDQETPQCGQCIKTGKECPGYDTGKKFKFREETEKVKRKAKLREPKTGEPSGQLRVGTTSDALTRRPSARSEDESISPPSSLSSSDPSTGSTIRSPIFEEVQLPVHLAPHVEDLASTFFNENYIRPGHLQFIEDLSVEAKLDPLLQLSCQCLGLAGVSHKQSSPELLRYTFNLYGKALVMANRTLQNREQAREDQLLVSILLLGLFEVVTCFTVDNLHQWTNHATGAIAVLRHRGKHHFHSRAGMTAFGFVSRAIAARVTFDYREPVPGHVLDWIKYYKNIADGFSRLSLELDEFAFELVAWRRWANSSNLRNPEDNVNRGLEWEQKLVAWAEKLSEAGPEYEYQCIYDSDAEPSEIWNGMYHVYYNFHTATAWQTYRVLRLGVTRIVLNHMKRAGYSGDHPEVLRIYHTRAQMIDDLCYATPFRLGSSGIKPSLRDNTLATAAGGLNAAFHLHLGAGAILFDDHFRLFEPNPYSQTSQTPSSQIKWMIAKLQSIYEVYGIGTTAAQAAVLEGWYNARVMAGERYKTQALAALAAAQLSAVLERQSRQISEPSEHPRQLEFRPPKTDHIRLWFGSTFFQSQPSNEALTNTSGS